MDLFYNYFSGFSRMNNNYSAPTGPSNLRGQVNSMCFRHRDNLEIYNWIAGLPNWKSRVFYNFNVDLIKRVNGVFSDPLAKLYNNIFPNGKLPEIVTKIYNNAFF